MKRLHCIISGIVQGVGFRFFVFRTASELELNGWVKNLFDERVELIVEGEEKKLKQFLEKIKKGPLFGRVESVEEKWQKATQEFNSFEIK